MCAVLIWSQCRRVVECYRVVFCLSFLPLKIQVFFSWRFSTLPLLGFPSKQKSTHAGLYVNLENDLMHFLCLCIRVTTITIQ